MQLLQFTLLTNLLFSGEPEVVPRNELVQDVGRADEAPGLPGKHAGGEYEGGFEHLCPHSIPDVLCHPLLRVCLVKGQQQPVAQSRVAGK